MLRWPYSSSPSRTCTFTTAGIWYLFWMVVWSCLSSHYYQLDKYTSLILPTLVDLVPSGLHKQLLGWLRILRILQVSRGGLSWSHGAVHLEA